jgi:hypothetical protein
MKSRSQSQRLCAIASDSSYRSTQAPLATRIQSSIEKVDAALNPFWRKVAFLGRCRVSLAITITVVLCAIAGRYYYSFVTGFLVPDEIWYYNTYILEKFPISSYRPAFVATFLLFFGGITNVWTFLLRGVLYSAIWAVGCVVLFFMIFRQLRVPENISSLLILSLPLFPIFIIFAPTILTETLGLFMALLGVYFALRHVQEGRMVNSLLSGVFFVVAANVREPYLLFAVGYILLFLALSLRRKSPRSIVGYAIPLSLLLLQFARGGNPQLASFISRLASPSGEMVPSSYSTNVGLGAWLASPLSMTLKLPPDLPAAIVIALWYGFNPLFALFAVLSIFAVGHDLLRNRSSDLFLLALNTVWSLGAFIGPVAFFLESIAGALSGWTSSIIRTAHASLPLIVCFPRLYSRLKVRRAAGLIIILLIVGSTQLGTLADAFQRSLSVEPVDRLSLDYRAPYYRLYLLARGSGKTLVFGGIEMRGIMAYMAMLPNVVLVPVWARGQRGALNETEFQALLEQRWDSIYLYDDWVTIKIPSWIDAYPEFYAQILRSRQYPGYTVQTLWIDGESYALKMVKTSDVIVTLPSMPGAPNPIT